MKSRFGKSPSILKIYWPVVPMMLLVLVVLFFARPSEKTWAQNFNLQIDDINTAPDEIIPTPTKSILSPRAKTVENETIKSGLQSIYQTGPIAFSVNADILDFGQITPSNPVIRNVILSATSESLNYQIFSFESNPPRTINNQSLPDTSCDEGSCSHSQSSIWENNLTYGFGFRCISKSILYCIEDFDKDYYRQFADISTGEKSTPVMNGLKNKEAQAAEISLKINASGTQEPGTYSNIVTFILVPSY